MTIQRRGWFKSSRSPDKADCVEVNLDDEEVAVRDSKDPDGGAFHLTRGAFNAFKDSLRRR